MLGNGKKRAGGQVHLKLDCGSFELRRINCDTLPQFPQRLPHDCDMNHIARHATKESAVSS
jgi:hypothetical protein